MDNYFLVVRKEYTFEDISALLKSVYERSGFACRYFIEGKGPYNVSEIDEASFVGLENTKNRLTRIIVERLATDSDRPLPSLNDYFTNQKDKICIHIRSEDAMVDQQKYLDKNLDLNELRQYIYNNLCTDN